MTDILDSTTCGEGKAHPAHPFYIFCWRVSVVIPVTEHNQTYHCWTNKCANFDEL